MSKESSNQNSGSSIPLKIRTESLNVRRTNSQDGLIISSSPSWGTGRLLATKPEKSDSEEGCSQDLHLKDEDPLSPKSSEMDAGGFETPSSFAFLHDHQLFRPILTKNEKNRQQALTIICDILIQKALTDEIQDYLGTIRRFAFDCPFPDISSSFKSLLLKLQDACFGKGKFSPRLPMTVSKFLDPKQVLPIDVQTEPERSLFKETFLEDGQVSHIYRLLAFFPGYYRKFRSSMTVLMKQPGPLSIPLRHYCAIIAASRYDCDYLLKQQEMEFLLNGGDPAWLKGYDSLPKRMQALVTFASQLIHVPWKLGKENMEYLIKQEQWSVAELVHAICVLSTSASLCSFIQGLGVLPEEEEEDEDRIEEWKIEQIDDDEMNSQIWKESNQKLLESLTLADTDESSSSQQQTSNEFSLDNDISSDGNNSNRRGLSFSGGRSEFSSSKKYLGGTDKEQYVDFGNNGFHYATTFSFKDNVYPMLTKYFGDSQLDQLLEEQFEYTYNLTEKKLSNIEGVDTSKFRHAIWFYTQRLYGIKYDDFPYEKTNSMLNKNLKVYIKQAACFPNLVKYADFANIGLHLQKKEKVHIAMIIHESRKQSHLIYGMQAIYKATKG